MAGQQKTEAPAGYQEKFDAIKVQMSKNGKLKKKFTSGEMDVMIKHSLIQEAKDKLEFGLRSALRRNPLAKINKHREEIGEPPISAEQWERKWRKNALEELEAAGYPMELDEKELEVLAAISERGRKEAAEEVTQIASGAFKKILQSV